MKTTLASIAFAAFAPIALAQQHTTSIQPQVPQKSTSAQAATDSNSGRDPFQLNWQTGRFDYVPEPYQQSPGAPYSPFQFNPFTGHFDYVPVPAPAAPDYGPRIEKGGGNASNYIDTRVNTQVPQAPVRPSGEAMPASGIIAPTFEPPPPTEIYRRPIPPTPMKAPSTRPAATQPAPGGAPPT